LTQLGPTQLNLPPGEVGAGDQQHRTHALQQGGTYGVCSSSRLAVSGT
jgi:hypothetical protein